jgi:hypothetical protein
METVKFNAYVQKITNDDVTIKFFKGTEHKGIGIIPRDSLINFESLAISLENTTVIEGQKDAKFRILRLDQNSDIASQKDITFGEFQGNGGEDSTGNSTSKTGLQLNSLNQ